jgi:hypothetical protein
MSYVEGTVIRVRAVFTAVDTDLPVEPGEVILRIDKPGTDTIEELKLSTGGIQDDPDTDGGYYADLDTTNGPCGTWHYQFESSGATKVVTRKQLTVRSRV